MSKGANKRKIKTDKELCNASIHVYYEIMMLNKVADSLDKRKRRKGFACNVLVESFVLHARNLIDFLFAPAPDKIRIRENSIIAADFLQDSKIIWPFPLPVDLEKERTRIHMRAAHLAYDRCTLPENWEYNKIRNTINDTFRKFRNHVPQNRIGDELKNYQVPIVSDLIAIASTTTAYSEGTKVSRDMFSPQRKK